jgi:hypothetical protein
MSSISTINDPVPSGNKHIIKEKSTLKDGFLENRDSLLIIWTELSVPHLYYPVYARKREREDVEKEVLCFKSQKKHKYFFGTTFKKKEFSGEL